MLALENRPIRKDMASKRKIPRIVWQTFKTSQVPTRLYSAAQSWWEVNPDCEYRFFEDDECRAMIEANFSQELLDSYDKLPLGAFRADIWRYCALYLHGGIYADMDTVCKYPMHKLIKDNDEFIVPYDANRTKLFNAFICSTPAHPVLQKVLERIPSKVLSATFDKDLLQNQGILYDITGPGGLAQAAGEALNLNPNHSFKAERYQGNNFNVRILRKIHLRDLRFRRVMAGFRTILMCKYPGYFDDLKQAGGTHWKHG